MENHKLDEQSWSFKSLSPSGSLIIEGFPALALFCQVQCLGFRYPHWEESGSALARLPLRTHAGPQMLNPSNGHFVPSYTVAVPEILFNTPTSPCRAKHHAATFLSFPPIPFFDNYSDSHPRYSTHSCLRNAS